jgi:hypothetical protein
MAHLGNCAWCGGVIAYMRACRSHGVCVSVHDRYTGMTRRSRQLTLACWHAVLIGARWRNDSASSADFHDGAQKQLLRGVSQYGGRDNVRTGHQVGGMQ